jgi:hypothetical protein
MAFSNQVQHGFVGFEENLDLPYADILEMPINFPSDSIPASMPSIVINYRHLFQSTKSLDSIFVIGILEHHPLNIYINNQWFMI